VGALGEGAGDEGFYYVRFVGGAERGLSGVLLEIAGTRTVDGLDSKRCSDRWLASNDVDFFLAETIEESSSMIWVMRRERSLTMLAQRGRRLSRRRVVSERQTGLRGRLARLRHWDTAF